MSKLHNFLLEFFINIYYFFYVLFHPSYWIQIKEYSKIYDKALNKILKEYEFKQQCDYYTKLGPYSIWIKNHPYGSYTIKIDGVEYRPSRMTIAKAHNKRALQIKSKMEKQLGL